MHGDPIEVLIGKLASHCGTATYPTIVREHLAPLVAELKRLRDETAILMAERDIAIRQRNEARTEAERFLEALTPSAGTKIAYSGEFFVSVSTLDDDGDEHVDRHLIPWSEIKAIMEAIRARAASATGDGDA